MRVLITGGTGFVGMHAARRLRRDGVAVRLLVRDPARARQLYARLREPPPELVKGDVADRASVGSALMECDAVVHAAAATPARHPSAAELHRVNVIGTRCVTGLAAEQGVRSILYLSSITAIFSTRAEAVNERSPLAPTRHPYGHSKAQAESYVRHLQAQGAPAAIVYPAAVVGPDDPGLSDASRALLHRFSAGFRITEGGMQHVDVRDLADFLAALLSLPAPGGRYLLPGPYLRWAELADLLEHAAGAPLARIRARGWMFRALGHWYDLKRSLIRVDSPISAETMRYSTQWPQVNTSPAHGLLGLGYRPPATTFADTLRWLVAAGHLPAAQAPRLAAAPAGSPGAVAPPWPTAPGAGSD